MTDRELLRRFATTTRPGKATSAAGLRIAARGSNGSAPAIGAVNETKVRRHSVAKNPFDCLRKLAVPIVDRIAILDFGQGLGP